MSQYRQRLHEAATNKALACCTSFKGDVLLVDSGNDKIIPPTVIMSYESAFCRARSLMRYTLSDADHQLTEPPWQLEYREVVLDWLNGHQARSDWVDRPV